MPVCSGPMKLQLSCLRVLILRWVAGCSHILPFIAGAMRTLALVAR